jgi:hypothetical protein
MGVIQDTIAASIASAGPAAAYAFDDPTGYGWDTAVFWDSEADQRIVSGVDAVVLDVARRYITQAGTLPSDLDYGLSIVLFLQGGIDGGPDTWSRLVELEALKDRRVVRAVCNWTVTNPREHTVSIQLEIATAAGVETRRLVFALTPSTVELLT